jgi:hypothetical protein
MLSSSGEGSFAAISIATCSSHEIGSESGQVTGTSVEDGGWMPFNSRRIVSPRPALHEVSSMELSNLTFIAFAIFSSLRIVSYVPQILKVAYDNHGATAISYSTWFLWTGANVATALYALVNLKDLYLAGISAVYGACCIVVIVLTSIKRRRMQHGPRRGADPANQRSALVKSIENHIAVESAALRSGARPHYTFEKELGLKSRRLVWHDLSRIFSRAKRRANGAPSAVDGATHVY